MPQMFLVLIPLSLDEIPNVVQKKKKRNDDFLMDRYMMVYDKY